MHTIGVLCYHYHTIAYNTQKYRHTRWYRWHKNLPSFVPRSGWCYLHLLLNCLKIHHSMGALPNLGLVVSAWWLVLPYMNTPSAQAGRTLGQNTWNAEIGCLARRVEQVSISHDSDDSICVPGWQRKFERSFSQLEQIPQETLDLHGKGGNAI